MSKVTFIYKTYAIIYTVQYSKFHWNFQHRKDKLSWAKQRSLFMYENITAYTYAALVSKSSHLLINTVSDNVHFLCYNWWFVYIRSAGGTIEVPANAPVKNLRFSGSAARPADTTAATPTPTATPAAAPSRPTATPAAAPPRTTATPAEVNIPAAVLLPAEVPAVAIPPAETTPSSSEAARKDYTIQS